MPETAEKGKPTKPGQLAKAVKAYKDLVQKYPNAPPVVEANARPDVLHARFAEHFPESRPVFPQPGRLHIGTYAQALADFQIAPDQSYQVHDLLTDARYLWHGAWNYVELNPSALPAHIFKVRRRVRTERDFDYFL